MSDTSSENSAPADSQADVIAFLSRPQTYGDAIRQVQRIDTHISHLFLAGDFAYKLKRAVVLLYLDFSTANKRKKTCRVELRINRRTAPDMYLGVLSVTRSPDGDLQLDGSGPAVDWLVKMRRFDEKTLFSNLAAHNKLTEPLMEQLAKIIADFHTSIARIKGGYEPDRTRSVLRVNRSSFHTYGGTLISEDRANQLTDRSLQELDAVSELLAERESRGFLRHCHGDLHLANICLFNGIPTLFDALEFNTAFAEIDVFYDLAFLLMDLDHWNHRHLANRVLNRYLDVTGDVQGLALLPLFLSMRAAVRSHVSLARIHAQPEVPFHIAQDTHVYFDLAEAYLKPGRPRLIAVGGLSGSGKSCLARALAPGLGAAPGARVVRTDVIRKQLSGVDLHDRLPPEKYSPEMSRQTYQTLYAEAREALSTGHSVICDAVFADPEERRQVEALAREMQVPFTGFWLEAPEPLLIQRVKGRTGDVSDATADVVRQQTAYRIGPVSWHSVDAAQTISSMTQQAMALIDPDARLKS